MDNSVLHYIENMDEPKRIMLLKIMHDLHNKTFNEQLQIIFTYSLEMKNKSLFFTNDEQKMILELLKSQLASNYKTEFLMLEQILNLINDKPY